MINVSSLKLLTVLTLSMSMVLGGFALVAGPSHAFADDSASMSTSVDASSTDMSVVPTVSADTTNPTLTFSFGTNVSDPTGDNPLPIVATFSEPVTGFSPQSIHVAIGHITDFTQVSPSLYTFNVVLDAPQGTMSIDSNDPGVRDYAGNIAIAAPQLHVAYDSHLTNNTGSTGTASTTTGTGSTGTGTSGNGSATNYNSWIVFTGGPADGSTISTSTATFVFTTGDLMNVQCSFGSDPAIYGCGSPQSFMNLVNGIYPFTVFGQYNGTTASSTRTFTVNLAAGTDTGSTGTDTGSTGTGSTTGTDTTGSTTTTTDTTPGSNSGTTSSTSGHGVSGSSVSGHGSSGSTTVVSGGTSTSTTGTTGNTNGPLSPVVSTTHSTGSVRGTHGVVLGTSTVATDTAATTVTTANSTTTAATGASKMVTMIVWSLLILLLLLILAGAYWYSRRRTS